MMDSDVKIISRDNKDKPEPTDCKICGYDDGHKRIDGMCISCYYDELDKPVRWY